MANRACELLRLRRYKYTVLELVMSQKVASTLLTDWFSIIKKAC